MVRESSIFTMCDIERIVNCTYGFDLTIENLSRGISLKIDKNHVIKKKDGKFLMLNRITSR